MAGIITTTPGDICVKINALMVGGNAQNKRGTIHHIIISRTEDNNVIPKKYFDELEEMTQRILTSRNDEKSRFTIDTRLKNEDIVNDLNSMGLPIAIGICLCLDKQKNFWETKLKTWCFTGQIGDIEGNIVKIGDGIEKVKAVIDDGIIRFAVFPINNRLEMENWLKKENYEYFEQSDEKENILGKGKTPSFSGRLWRCFFKKSSYAKIALLFWIISIVYVPIRFYFWESLLSRENNTNCVYLQLPIKDINRTKNVLVKKGFSEKLLNGNILTSLMKAQAGTKALLVDKNGELELEIVSSSDGTMILAFTCIAYIGIFTSVVFAFTLVHKNSESKFISKKYPYTSIHLANLNKEIIFVGNIKEIEKIITSKSASNK